MYKNRRMGLFLQRQKEKINDKLYKILSQNKLIKECLDEYIKNTN